MSLREPPDRYGLRQIKTCGRPRLALSPYPLRQRLPPEPVEPYDVTRASSELGLLRSRLD
jgi:hypothetical protein